MKTNTTYVGTALAVAGLALIAALFSNEGSLAKVQAAGTGPIQRIDHSAVDWSRVMADTTTPSMSTGASD